MPFNPRQQANYFTTLRQLVRGNESFVATVYQPNDHVPTIGYGYTFVRFGSNGWAPYDQPRLDADMAAIGRPLTDAQSTLLDRIARARNDHDNALANTLIAQFSTSFGAISEVNAQTLFQQEANSQADLIRTRFRNVLGQTNGNTLFNNLANTTEMMAIFDIAYYRGAGNLRAELIQAMNLGDRASAWYELRYHELPSNPQPGHPLRNYRDADLFGLYEQPGTSSQNEAKQVYRMFTLNRISILQYEQSYTPPADIQSLDAALNPAKLALIASLNSTNNLSLTPADYLATNIYLDPGRDTAVDPVTKQAVVLSDDHSAVLNAIHYDSNGNEIVSKDILIGEGGNDYLMGGKDDDVLLGGTGRDVYYYRIGDGTDRIVDPDGGLLVMSGDEGNQVYATGDFTKIDDSHWTHTQGDNTVTLTHDGTWTLSIAPTTGSTSGGLDLGNDFDPAKYGIRLAETPVVPATYAHTIVGDHAPAEFTGTVAAGDAIPDGWINPTVTGTDSTDVDGQTVITATHYQYNTQDVLGNYTPGAAEADRADSLNGSDSADLIQSLGGDDSVTAKAGADRIEGGAGSDIVRAGSGNDIAIGGADADILYGEGDNDTLYADAPVSLADAYTLGETQAAIAGQGELLSGDAGDDRLIGAGTADALWGGAGKDVLYGGNGNDYLIGDSSVSDAQRDWRGVRNGISTFDLTGVSFAAAPSAEQGDDMLSTKKISGGVMPRGWQTKNRGSSLTANTGWRLVA